MKWFKHFTDWHRDPVLADCTRRYGHVTVELFNLLKEVYAENYDRRDARGFASVRLFYILDCLKIRQPLLKNIGDFLKNERYLDFFIENDVFLFYLPEFERLIGNWRQRQNHCPVATVSHERGNEEEKKEEEKIYEEEKKEDSGDDVLGDAADILDYFNRKTGKSLLNDAFIVSLLREGRKKTDFLKIIDVKSLDDFFRKNRKLFNLQTLFGGDHFEKYLAEYYDQNTDSGSVPVVSAPAKDDSLRVKRAFLLYLTHEFDSLQSGFQCLLVSFGLNNFVASLGHPAALDDVAVVSFENQLLCLFSPHGFHGFIDRLASELFNCCGVKIKYIYDVPADFISSEFFAKYSKK